MRLTIPDDLADQILQLAPVGAKSPLIEDVILRVLKKALPLVQEGGLALSARETEQLAEITLLPSIATGQQLVIAVRQLNDLKIGQHRLKLEPAVLNELRARAQREGREYGQVLQQTVDRIGQEIGALL